MHDTTHAGDAVSGSMTAAMTHGDTSEFAGVFQFECTDSEGNVLWRDEVKNLITTLGKNALLDNTLATPASLVGPYMGLISSASFSAVSAADTMASHAGWLECNGTNAPNYSGARQTAAFSAAASGSKAMSAGLSFVFSNSGTVQGSFLVLGSGAVTTNTSTAGTLFNAVALSTPQPVINTNTLTVSYTPTIT